jgi:6-phosphogluconolactonase (cycloisomerase 2 family)
MRRMRMSRADWISILVLVVGQLGAGPDEKGDGRLKFVESIPRDDLAGASAVAIDPDGKFLYATGWKSSSVLAFARDAKTGTLDHRQTISSQDILQGATSLSVSPDGRLAFAAAFRSRAAVLYLRDAATGELTQADVAGDGGGGVRFSWPIRTVFSPSSKFAYVLDDMGPGGQGAVVAFRVRDDALELVAIDLGRDGCYHGARGFAFHPDNKTLFVTCSKAGTLVVADCDAKTGVTNVRQVIKDDEEDARGLAGALGVVVSPDGRFVYVSSGRFGGDNAVSAFRLDSDGRLSLLQEFVDGDGTLRGFEGGNQLTISPDGLNVYASATLSGAVASFRRDPATGRLTFLETLPDGGEGDGLGAGGIRVSPDGDFVYVATEDKKALSVFKRASDK